MTSRLNLLELGGAGSAALTGPDGERVSYQEAGMLISRCRAALAWPAKALVVVHAPRRASGLLAYLAGLSAGHALILVEDASKGWWEDLIAAYQPELLITRPGGDVAVQARRWGFRLRTADPVPVWGRPDGAVSTPIHPALALLARTSGSLGPPKMVRLSYGNLWSNATAIATAIGLCGNDRVMTSLRLDFAFGLSMVNSAFAAGASVVLSPYSPASRPFWEYLDHTGGTCVGAVPSTYLSLRGRGWDPGAHPSLRLLLHAGGPLDGWTLAHFGTRMAAQGGELISMYGQTEATARISCLRGALAATRSGSSGVPVPGTRVRIERPDGAQAAAGQVGEIVVDGPGVMMGYASTRDDLASGDLQGRVLRTGDLGFLHGGFLYVAGRADRQVKVLGRRVDLDQVEKEFLGRGLTSAVEVIGGERLVVAIEGAVQGFPGRCRSLAERFGLPTSAVRVIRMDPLPRTGNGKIDHRAVQAALLSLPGCRERLSGAAAPPETGSGEIAVTDETSAPPREDIRRSSSQMNLPGALELVRQWVGSGECLGVQLFVWRDGRAVADLAIGRSGVSRTASSEDLGRLYCAVKPLIACCLARAVEAGQASFDDPVSRFVPDFRAGPRDAITLRQLLSHTSGLPWMAVGDPYEHDFRELVSMACAQRTAPQRWYRKPVYNALLAWAILAAAVEQIYGLAIADVVTQEISDPAGLPALRMTWPDAARYAPCHYLRGSTFTPLPEPSHATLFSRPNPAQGGFGSARDLGLLYGELICCAQGEGTLLRQDLARELVRQHSVIELAPGFGERTYGLGFFTNIRSDAVGGNWAVDSFGHSGHVGRYRVVHAFGDIPNRVAVAARLFSVGAKNNWRFRRLGAALWSDLGLGPVHQQPAP